MAKVIVIFVLVWVVAVGLLYVEFQNNPVREMDVRDGRVVGEKGFLEARAAQCTCFTMAWVVAFVFALLKLNARKPTPYEPPPQG